MSSFNEPEESTADILYPTMRNMKPKTSSFADVLSGNSSSKKSSSTLLGASDFDDEPEFRKYKVDFDNSDTGKADLRRVESNGVSELDNVRASATTGQRPAGATGSRESKSKTEDWKTKQIKDENERIAKLKRTADILYGKTTPEHGIYWKGDTDNSSSIEKDNDVEKVKTDTSSKISDVEEDDEDILDLFYPTMKNLKSKNKTSSIRDEIKSQTSSDPAKVSDDDEEDDILDIMYPSMANLRRTELSDSERVRKSESRSSDRLLPAGATGSRESKFKTGMKNKSDNEPTSVIKDEIEKATSSNLPKFSSEKEETGRVPLSRKKMRENGFDSGMKIPDFADNFDEGFDFDKTDNGPGNEIEEKENDFSSEISDKKKKSDKNGIVTGGAAEISKNQNEYLPTKSGKILNDNGIDLVFGNDVDINKKTGVKADFELAKKGAKALFQVFKEDMKITDKDWKEINKNSYFENKLASDIIKTRLLLSKLGEKFSNSDVTNRRYDEIMKRIGKDKSKEMIEDYLAGSCFSEGLLSSQIGYEAANLLKLSQENIDVNKKFTKNADKYQSAYDLPEKYQNTVAKKLASQYMPVNSKGLVFHSNSESAKHALEQTELQDILVKNLNDIVIKSAKNEPCEYTVTFEKNMNFRLAFHKADVKNLKITPLGTITGDIIDVTDFNGNENDVLIRAGRELQEEGKLKPIFVVIHFAVKLEDIYALKLQRENK